MSNVREIIANAITDRWAQKVDDASVRIGPPVMADAIISALKLHLLTYEDGLEAAARIAEEDAAMSAAARDRHQDDFGKAVAGGSHAAGVRIAAAIREFARGPIETDEAKTDG